MVLAALLHLHETAHTEEVPAAEADRFECDARADGAGVVVDMRDNRKEDLTDGLYEEVG